MCRLVTKRKRYVNNKKYIFNKKHIFSKKNKKEVKMRVNLKVLRVSKNMSQSEIAKKLGVTITYYAYIERGLRDGSHEFWNKLKETFNIPENEMWSLMKKEEE